MAPGATAPALAAALASLALLIGAVALADVGGNARQQPPVVKGMSSFDFYKRSCLQAESIVRGFAQDAVHKDAGLLLLHFHDCFVYCCDPCSWMGQPPGRQAIIISRRRRPT